jgi:hypothetical protein
LPVYKYGSGGGTQSPTTFRRSWQGNASGDGYWRSDLGRERLRRYVQKALKRGDVLSLLGGVILDGTRAVEGDGRAPESSAGIWQATRNLESNGGFETDLANWNVVQGTLTRDTAQAKFGGASMRVDYTFGTRFYAESATAENFAAGDVTASAWVRPNAQMVGKTVDIQLQEGGGAVTVGPTVTLVAGWQRIVVTRSFAGPATGHVYIEMKGAGGGSPAAGDQIWIDGVQIEQQPASDITPYASPYVETNGAPASRAAGQVLAPSRILNAAQGWIALRVRPEWSFSADLYNAGDIYLFDWFGDATNFLRLFYNPPNDLWIAQRRGSAGLANATKAGAHAIGATLTLVFAWEAGQHKLSLNGSAFTANATAQTPAGLPSRFSLGAGQDGANPMNGEMLWALAGTGTLADADAATINGYGDNDPDVTSAPGTATFLWTAVDDEWVEQEPRVMIFSSDSGSGSDSATLTTSIAATDVGTGADSAKLVAAIPAADAGAGAEASQLAAAIPATDAGSGSESAQLSASLAASDAGVGADAAALAASLSASDAGTGVDVAVARLFIFSSDAGSGVDTATLTATIPATDSGSGTDLASLAASLSSSDVASGSETAALAAVLVANETGSGADAAALKVVVAVADAGTGTDSDLLNAILAASEVGVGSEQSSIVALLAPVDAGVGSDSAQLAAALADAEFGTGLNSEALSAVLADLDSASGEDSGQMSVMWAVADSGVGLDTEAVIGLLQDTDVATGEDAAVITSINIFDADSGQGTETAVLEAQLHVFDQGTAIEQAVAFTIRLLGTIAAGRIAQGGGRIGGGPTTGSTGGAEVEAPSIETGERAIEGRIAGPSMGEVGEQD